MPFGPAFAGVPPEAAAAVAGPAGTAAEAVADGIFTGWPLGASAFGTVSGDLRGNTTIGAVITDAALTKAECRLLAISAQDGLARAVFQAHTRSDGDALVAAATNAVAVGEGDLDILRVLATAAVQRAVVSAC